MADTQNVEFFAGEDIVITVTVTGVDITGYTLIGDIRKNRLHRNPALMTAAGSITDAANGVFTLTFADTASDDLPPGVYYWAAKRTDTGSETVLTVGTLTIKATAAH